MSSLSFRKCSSAMQFQLKKSKFRKEKKLTIIKSGGVVRRARAPLQYSMTAAALRQASAFSSLHDTTRRNTRGPAGRRMLQQHRPAPALPHACSRAPAWRCRRWWPKGTHRRLFGCGLWAWRCQRGRRRPTSRVRREETATARRRPVGSRRAGGRWDRDRVMSAGACARRSRQAIK